MYSHVKVLGIDATELSWGDLKTIESDKIASISSDVSEKQIIVYTSLCIELSRINKTHYNFKRNGSSSSHARNDGETFWLPVTKM